MHLKAAVMGGGLLWLALGLLQPAIGQEVAFRHPEPAAEWVGLHAAAPTTAVYRLGEQLLWQQADQVVARTVPGPVLHTAPSRLGAFLGVLAGPSTADSTVRIQVYDRDGGLQADVAWPHAPDTPFPVMAVEEATGRLAVGHPATSEVAVFDAAGRERVRRRVFEDSVYDLEKSLRVVWLPEEEAFVVAALRAAVGPEQRAADNLHVVCFAADGRERWRFTPALPDLQALTLLADGDERLIAVASYDAYAADGPVFQTQVLSPAGTERFRAMDGFEQAAYRASTQTLLLATRDAAVAYDLTAGTERFRFAPDDPEGLILDAALSEDGEAGLLMLSRSRFTPDGFRFEGAEAVRLGAAGQVRQVWSMAHDASFPPRLMQLDAPNEMGAVTAQATYRIPWRQP